MIEKLKGYTTDITMIRKIDELVGAVNELQKHEEQHLDLLTQLNEMRLQQMKELEIPAENVQKEIFISIDEALKNAEKMISTANRYYLYVKYKHLIGKLCKFKWGQGCYYGILTNIKRKPTELPFESNGRAFSNCEPVKPDDDIICKGGDNEK